MDGVGVRSVGSGSTAVRQNPQERDADQCPVSHRHKRFRKGLAIQHVARWVIFLGTFGSQVAANPLVPACELRDRELVWSEPSFLTSFLYGSAERFTLVLDGKTAATGDARDERVLTPQALEQLIFSTFAETRPIESTSVNGVFIDYTSLVDGDSNVIYLRVRLEDRTVGFGFFSEHENISIEAGEGRVATFYFVDRADQKVKDLRIEYLIPTSSACIIVDGIRIILDRAEGRE